MERTLDTNAYLDTVCQILGDGGELVPVPVTGVSMRPFLRTGDYVYVKLPEEPIRRGDILLFQRPNGQYVLHRVMAIRGARYLMLGDSQLEMEPIYRNQIRARAVSARIRGGMITRRSFRWWLFACPWRWLAPWRRQIIKLWSYVKKAVPEQ